MERDLDRVASGDIAWANVIGEFYTPFSKDVEDAESKIPELKLDNQPLGRNCPESGHELVIRWGRYGKFISCSNFPECRYTEPWLEKIGVSCPQDGGDIIRRKTRKGRIFYGCSNYPECDFTSWKRPIKEPCPNCGKLLVRVNTNHVQCTGCEERFSLDEIVVETTEETDPA